MASIICQGQIIADHSVVDKYDDIPQHYIDKVKAMWIVIAGESHSEAYRAGLTLLEGINPAFAVSVKESGTPESYTNLNLRCSRATWGDYSNSSGWIYGYGEEDWFTNSTAIARTKTGIAYCNTHNLAISAIGFGWCWDPVGDNVSTTADAVYGCRWYGWSEGSISGDCCWGLDASDYPITGNSVSMDTYLHVTKEYTDYCSANGLPTKVFFTTGPVDSYYNAGERGYQGSIKYDYIRSYVKADHSRILFDYADILCYDNDGTPSKATWNNHTFPIISPTNLGDETIGHIGSAGAIRLAKAMWWMLARIAGWDGVTTEVDDLLTYSKIWIEFNSEALKVHLIENITSGKANLYSIAGNLKASKNIDSDLISFNTSDLSPGLYILTIQHASGTESKKILIH